MMNDSWLDVEISHPRFSHLFRERHEIHEDPRNFEVPSGYD